MQFSDFQKLFTEHSKRVLSHGNLFLLDVDRDELWNTYLESYPPEYNQVFRERRGFDCACCRQFVKNYGALAAITADFEVVTLWDFNTNDSVYQPMLDGMRRVLHAEVDRAFFAKTPKLGTRVNIEELADGYLTWNHLYMEVPDSYVTPNVAEKQEEKRAIASVFKRSLDGISADSIATVLELIEEKILYRGEEWLGALAKFQQIHRAYHSTPMKKRTKFAWRMAEQVGIGVAKIRNHSIGTLLTNLSEGMDVELAMKKYESIMAPTNYKRPTAAITKRMVENAQRVVEEMGLVDSLPRRHSVLSDLTINNVLWANRSARKGNTQLDVFSQLREEIRVNPTSLRNVQPISIEEFLQHSDNYQSIEILFEPRLAGNLVSLTAPQNPDATSLFKWSNPFAWAYNGNVADAITQQVKSAGGNVDGPFRFSPRWNTQGDNRNDYDAHAITPDGRIYFGDKRKGYGQLDVDIQYPSSDQVAVENIYWPSLDKITRGIYKFGVHCYAHRGGTSGFDAEIYMNGELYHFDYPKNLKHDETIWVAEVTWDGRQFSIKPLLDTRGATVSSKNIWGIATNQFHPVSVAMLSPNHWDGQGVGNRHFFFMLNGCVNDGVANGFYNEFLHEALTPHKKVFEALGSKMKVEPSEHQLSGLGFSSTKRESVIVRINNRQLAKIVF